MVFPSRQNPWESLKCSSFFESTETTSGGRQWHLVCLCVLLSVVTTDVFPRPSIGMAENEVEVEDIVEVEVEVEDKVEVEVEVEDKVEVEVEVEVEDEDDEEVAIEEVAVEVDLFLFLELIIIPPFRAAAQGFGTVFRPLRKARPNGLESKTFFKSTSEIKFPPPQA